MAVYQRTDSINSTSSQTMTMNSEQNEPKMGSVSLGDVIVQSFENTMSNIQDNGVGIFNHNDEPLTVEMDEKSSKLKKEKIEVVVTEKLKEKPQDKQDDLSKLLTSKTTTAATSALIKTAVPGVAGAALSGLLKQSTSLLANKDRKSPNNKQSESEKTSALIASRKKQEAQHEENKANVKKSHNLSTMIKEDVTGIKKMVQFEMIANLLKHAVLLQGISGLLHYFPAVVGGIAKVINNIPLYWQSASNWMKLTFSGPDSIFQRAKRWIQSEFNNLFMKMAASDNPVVAALGGALFKGTGGTITNKYKMSDLSEDQQKVIYDLIHKYGLTNIMDDQGNIDLSYTDINNKQFQEDLDKAMRNEYERTAQSNLSLQMKYGKNYVYQKDNNWEQTFAERISESGVTNQLGTEILPIQFTQMLDENKDVFNNLISKIPANKMNAQGLAEEVERIKKLNRASLDKEGKKTYDFIKNLEEIYKFKQTSDWTGLMLDYNRYNDYDKVYAQERQKTEKGIQDRFQKIIDVDLVKDKIFTEYKGYDKEKEDLKAQQAQKEYKEQMQLEFSRENADEKLTESQWQTADKLGLSSKKSRAVITQQGTIITAAQPNKLERFNKELEGYFQNNTKAMSDINLSIMGVDFSSALASVVTPFFF